MALGLSAENSGAGARIPPTLETDQLTFTHLLIFNFPLQHDLPRPTSLSCSPNRTAIRSE